MMSAVMNTATIKQLLADVPKEGRVRIASRDWTTAEFDHALEEARSYCHPLYYTTWMGLLRRLRDERSVNQAYVEMQRSENLRMAASERAADARAISAEKANQRRRELSEQEAERRHADLVRRLDDLKQPHWSVVPNSWIALVAALAAIAAAIFGWMALKQ